ncbi:retron system putative HNH endonuclease [Chryseobacterium oryctis]|uniref:TIGR02646 family protein n=1 Tax=Chryseobacterium oryctis TaxID=2952618 RepID=A0ABT3HRR5_9FLAO|nr:retron system putative HNH endonuclease [Chryseobacterium oryctis]MCW3162466.1 TIGR02646 family protein [Chryseobacterium oryctis]
MKQIIKIQEPNSLIKHRANQPAFYDGLSQEAKEELRKNLLTEQGHICCYCMKRIPENTSPYMKVEHYKCQDYNADLQLTYSNLFGACAGGEGKPKKLQTCDTQKGNQSLTINLLTNAPNCETQIRYNANGEISSDNDEIDRQLNEVLNLNMQTLKDGRKEIYLSVQKEVEAKSKQIGNKQLKLKYFQQEKEKWLTKKDNKYRQFCMIAVYYLEKKIRQNQN